MTDDERLKLARRAAVAPMCFYAGAGVFYGLGLLRVDVPDWWVWFSVGTLLVVAGVYTFVRARRALRRP